MDSGAHSKNRDILREDKLVVAGDRSHGAGIKRTGWGASSLKCLSHTLSCRSTAGCAAWSDKVTEVGQERE